MNTEEDNRKRGLQDDIDGAFSSKRAALGQMQQYGHYGGGGGDMEGLYFKILCPQSITGLIIGRGGSIINHLNTTCGARIKLSQNNEYFPGTNDRILILNGSKEGIANALRELVTRIADAPDKKPNSNAPVVDMYGNPIPPVNRAPNGAYQIKVVIPKPASAAIIGKSGAVVKHMSDISNCKFQLGEEGDPYDTKERIVVLTATTVGNLVNGSQTIMAQLLEDPRIRSYANVATNYLSMGGGGGRMHAGGPQGMGGMPMGVMGGPGNPMGGPGPQMMPGMMPGPMMSSPSPYGMPPQMPPGYAMSPYGMVPAGMQMSPMPQPGQMPPGSMAMPPQQYMMPAHQYAPQQPPQQQQGQGPPNGVGHPHHNMQPQQGGMPGGANPMRGGAPGAYNPYGYSV